MKHAPHVVIEQAGLTPHCLHCGAREPMALPMEVKDFCAATERFRIQHVACPKPEMPPVACAQCNDKGGISSCNTCGRIFDVHAATMNWRCGCGRLAAWCEGLDFKCDKHKLPSEPPPPEGPAAGILGWWRSDKTGLSSRALARCLLADRHGSVPVWAWVPPAERDRYPHDPADLRRCIEMMATEPDFRSRLAVARDMSPVWSRMVDAWPTLERMLKQELADCEARRIPPTAPRTYATMRKIIEETP